MTLTTEQVLTLLDIVRRALIMIVRHIEKLQDELEQQMRDALKGE